MSSTELQHYVPRFYLKRFADTDGHVWVLDKTTLRVFSAGPGILAGVRDFYRASDPRRLVTDPRHLENQLSVVEGEAARIITAWLQRSESGKALDISHSDRESMSLFLALQMLRTAETRAQLVQFDNAIKNISPLSSNQHSRAKAAQLHADLLWDDELITALSAAVKGFIWILARNTSGRRLYTSDHPVHCKTPDSKQWILGPRLFDRGVYFVFPLSPSILLYCKEPDYWRKLGKFDGSVSPVELTDHMVDHANSGQVGMSTRFVFADRPDFEFAKMFCELHPEIRDPARERYYWSAENPNGGQSGRREDYPPASHTT